MAVIYYTESTPTSASSGNVAAAAANATLTGVSGRITYITGFTVSGAGATAGSNILVTVTGVVGGTQTYNLVIPTGATVSIVPLQVNFPMPLASTALGGSITVNVPSFGAGSTNASTVAYGYYK